jgi:hypothetical protein
MTKTAMARWSRTRFFVAEEASCPSAVPASGMTANATALTRTHRPNRRQSYHLAALPLASVIMARHQQWIDSLLSVVPLGYLGPWGLPSDRCH